MTYDQDLVQEAIWEIIEFIDDKPGTRTLFHELIKLLQTLLHEEE